MSKDRDYRRMICTARWQRVRRAELTAHPVCRLCGHSFATEVHHVTPVEWAKTEAEKERRMFDPKNLRAVCHACHVEEHKRLRSRSRNKLIQSKKEFTARALKRLFDPDPGGSF